MNIMLEATPRLQASLQQVRITENGLVSTSLKTTGRRILIFCSVTSVKYNLRHSNLLETPGRRI
jgi:hypothetical protein